MKFGQALGLLLLVGSCGDIPKDPEGTRDRVRSEHAFTTGLISSGPVRAGRAREELFLARVAKAAGARPRMIEGTAEALLTDLEAGKLDLVIGALSPDSPWVYRVALLTPVGEITAGRHLLITPMARNGENAWISLLEREARAVAADTDAR